MDGTRDSVKCNSSWRKIANFSFRARKTFSPGTGLQLLGNTLQSRFLLMSVAAEELFRGKRKPPEGNSPSNEVGLYLRSGAVFVSSPQRKKVPGGILAGEKGI
jgi:hypothetical protein